ncbi:10939_t:CDS:2, partial [Gigaspora rosea]
IVEEKESQKLQVVKQIVEENYKWSNRSWKKRYHEDREATNHKKGHEVINHEGHEVTTHEDHEVTNYESYEVTSHEDHEIMKEKESQKLQDVEEKESQKLQVAKQIVKEKEFLKLKQIVEEKESQKLQIVKQIAKEKESQKLQEVHYQAFEVDIILDARWLAVVGAHLLGLAALWWESKKIGA